MTPIDPFRGSNRDIERLAEIVKETAFNGGDGRPGGKTLLRQLVSRTGGEVVIAEDPADQEADGGSLVIRGFRDFTIFSSPFTTPLRDNFTIAHELGHYVLHYLPNRERLATPLWFARYGTGPLEWQANRFAAALLMPEREFREAFTASDGDLTLLSGRFEVSLPVVQTRADTLGLPT